MRVRSEYSLVCGVPRFGAGRGGDNNAGISVLERPVDGTEVRRVVLNKEGRRQYGGDGRHEQLFTFAPTCCFINNTKITTNALVRRADQR